MKKIVTFLLGLIVGVVGFYFVAREPNVLIPDSPTNLAILLKQAVDNNDLSRVQNLMMPKQKAHFTSSDLNSLRNYIKVGTFGERGSGIDTYLVMSFPNHQVITVWIVPPLNGKLWRIQSISEGLHVAKTY